MFSGHEGGKNLPLLMDQVFDDSYAPLSELILGYKRYRTLIWALESGIADILDRNGPMEEGDLLARTGISSDYGSIWIEALLGIQILVKNEGLLSINPLLRSYLVTESPLYQGDSLRSTSQGFWSHDFPVLDGEGAMHVRNPGGMTPDFLKVVYQHSMRGEIQEISRILSARHDFQQARHMLDIGGGHGMYTISFCQQNPSLSAVILDKP